MKEFDVIIIGGSYAGLSAAMALGRAMRQVLILDSGMPCNQQTPHSHNFLTHDGETPAKIATKAKQQVLQYSTIRFLEDKVTDVKKVDQSFDVKTEKGNQYHSKKILFATGVRDIFPAIKGFSECWGISVIHCPYCHGYEVRNKKTGVLANGDIAYHFSALIHNWTKDLTLFTNGKSTLTTEQRDVLNKLTIEVVEEEITLIHHDHGSIQSLEFANGKRIPLEALYAKIATEQSTPLPAALGCELTEQGFIKIDEMQKTTVEGIYAAGDNTHMFRAVSIAVADGTKAGAMINHDLVQHWVASITSPNKNELG